MSPATKSLFIIAAAACGVVGMIGFQQTHDIRKLLIILAFSGCLICLVYGLEYIVALSKYHRMKMLYEMDVLNMYVYFDDDYIRVVGLGNREICRLDYCEVTRYFETDKYAVMGAGWQLFIFDKKQGVRPELQRHLDAHDANLVFRKTNA